ncbi:MAG: lipocalin-like domain-containing protein [Alphaproteobacteria bacterium]|nr:lipocalin-like domain-containing protein [Alphaproteobacteria bacterium]
MLREKLIGAWMLESYAEYPVDRSAPFYPLGEDAKGLILYTADGYMSAQVLRVGRPHFASGDWQRAVGLPMRPWHDGKRAAAKLRIPAPCARR